MLFHLTLKQGHRSDTLYLESSSETKIKNFIKAVSTADLISLKKVVYSKKFGIAYQVTNFIESKKHNEELEVIVESKNFVDLINIKYSKKDLTKDTIVKTIKKYLLLNNEPILTIISIEEKHIDEGVSPNGGK